MSVSVTVSGKFSRRRVPAPQDSFCNLHSQVFLSAFPFLDVGGGQGIHATASSSASTCSPSFFPACRNSSLSRVPATARDNDSAPYIKAINPSAFSRLSTPVSSILANEVTMSDNSFSSAPRYGSPSRATSGAAQGSMQPVSLLSRCLRDRYRLITLSARARGEAPFAYFKRESQVEFAAFRSASTKSSSFERPILSIIGLPNNKKPGEPFTPAPSTNTTTRFQLSISVLISFFLPAGAAFSRWVLVVGDAAARGRQRTVKTFDPTDACVFAFLDSAADDERRILGRRSGL